MINCIRGFPDFEWVVGIGGLLYATGEFNITIKTLRFRKCLLCAHSGWFRNGTRSSYLGNNAGKAQNISLTEEHRLWLDGVLLGSDFLDGWILQR